MKKGDIVKYIEAYDPGKIAHLNSDITPASYMIVIDRIVTKLACSNDIPICNVINTKGRRGWIIESKLELISEINYEQQEQYNISNDNAQKVQ